MFVILGLLAVAPMAVYPAVGAEIYQVVPFSASFFKILLPTLLFTLAGGFLPVQKVSACSLQERAKPCGDAWKIRKPLPGIWRHKFGYLLPVTLTGLFLAAGLALMVPPEFHSKVVEYTMGVLPSCCGHDRFKRMVTMYTITCLTCRPLLIPALSGLQAPPSWACCTPKKTNQEAEPIALWQ